MAKKFAFVSIGVLLIAPLLFSACSDDVVVPPPVSPQPPKFILKWGSQGMGDGQFEFPFGVAVDGTGNVYVVDRDNHRIQKFK